MTYVLGFHILGLCWHDCIATLNTYKKKKRNNDSLFLSLLFCPNLDSGKLARCKGRVRLPARDTNSSGDDDDDDGAVDALSPSKKRGTKMNTTTSDFQEASKGKLEKCGN